MRIQFTIVGTVERHVWYPLGDDEDEDTTPFVYVVLGQRRP